MSEMSDMHKLIMAMKLAKTAQVGMELTYFDVIELLGELDSLKSYIAELEALVDELVNIGDNLFDSLNPIAWKHEWLDKWWKLSSCRRGERE